MKPSLLFAAVPLGLAVLACGPTEEEGPDVACEEGQCDGLPFPDQLKGREDPIAKWLQQLSNANVIDTKAVFHGDQAGEIAPADDPQFYGKMLAGIATVQGCQPNSAIAYALSDDLITSNADQIYPRLITTVCSDNDKVTNAFVATLGDPQPDINLADLEMFAWDPTAQKYNFYATKDIGDGNLEIEVAPARCVKCHTTPRDVDPVGMPSLPIMNELTKPWTHWQAGTGGVSESFSVPASLDSMPNWSKYKTTIGAASRLEKVIRDANAQRVTPARARALFRPAKLEEAMGLIRPLFCDEQVNYVAELGTGELTVDAFVSGGTKAAFRAVDATWPWAWFNNDNVSLTPVDGDQRLFMMPVRGVAETTFEAQLQSVLSPTHVLALRAIDWKKAVFSDARCNLWRDAMTKFATTAPALSGRNRDAVKVLFDEIMKNGGMSIRNLGAGKFVAIANADETTMKALKDAIAAGSVPTSCADSPFCEVDANGFGTLLETYVESLPGIRAELLAERDRRVCAVHAEVEPAGGHKTTTNGQAGPRIMNDPSFVRVDEQGVAKSTLPQCN